MVLAFFGEKRFRFCASVYTCLSVYVHVYVYFSSYWCFRMLLLSSQLGEEGRKGGRDVVSCHDFALRCAFLFKVGVNLLMIKYKYT